MSNPTTTAASAPPMVSITSGASLQSKLPTSGSLSSKNPLQFTFSLETPSLSSGTLDKYLKSVLGTESSSAIPDLLKPQGEGNQATSTVSSASSDNAPPKTSETHKEVPPQLPISTSSESQKKSTDNVSSEQPQQQQQHHQVASPSHDGAMTSSGSNQLATTMDSSNEVIPIPRGQSYVDITEYLNMPQAEAAKKLGIPPSTLSKRWKEAVRKRKWPYRMICKIDKEIMTLLHNVPQGPNAPPLPEEIESALGHLLRKRQEELRPVVIRI